MKLTYKQKSLFFKAQSAQLIERLVVKAERAGLTVEVKAKHVQAKSYTLCYIVSGRICLSADMSLVQYRAARQDINIKIQNELIESLAKAIHHATKHRVNSKEILEKAIARTKRMV